MDDFFKKTINYFNTPGSLDDDFVGEIVEVGAIKLKILKKIAEGMNRKIKQNRTFFISSSTLSIKNNVLILYIDLLFYITFYTFSI